MCHAILKVSRFLISELLSNAAKQLFKHKKLHQSDELIKKTKLLLKETVKRVDYVTFRIQDPLPTEIIRTTQPNIHDRN